MVAIPEVDSVVHFGISHALLFSLTSINVGGIFKSFPLWDTKATKEKCVGLMSR